MRITTRLNSTLRTNHGKALTFAGTALALAGAGTASAATTGPVTLQPAAVARHQAAPHARPDRRTTRDHHGTVRGGAHRGAHQAAHPEAGRSAHRGSRTDTRHGARTAAQHRAGHHPETSPEAHRARLARIARIARIARRPDTIHAVLHQAELHTWPVAAGALPPRDRLRPTPPSGPQAYLPITPARQANADTIVHQALRLHMGVRSAVIAVATAIQESTLENISYGDRDSLGLFQQRPSCGWGTPAQITDPAYAADAFLGALHRYQQANPGWATQPLWQAAQGVQNSGFPYAYAKWETQAAQIVSATSRHLL